jgi:hypothetical protein
MRPQIRPELRPETHGRKYMAVNAARRQEKIGGKRGENGLERGRKRAGRGESKAARDSDELLFDYITLDLPDRLSWP